MGEMREPGGRSIYDGWEGRQALGQQKQNRDAFGILSERLARSEERTSELERQMKNIKQWGLP